MAQHSRYHQLADLLRERILAGEWKAGERLPTIDVLAQELGASRNTVNRAIGELEVAGLVWAVQGRGVTVREGILRPRRTRGDLVKRNVHLRGYSFPSATANETWVRHGEARSGPATLDDARIAGLLGVKPGSMVWCRWRVTGPAGEAPFQINISWIHPRVEELVRDVDRNPAAGEWLYRIEKDGGHWPLKWVEFDIARMPTKDEATALEIPTSLPVREIDRQGNSGTDGKPVEVTQYIIPADRVMTVRVLQREGLAAEPWPEENVVEEGGW